MAVVLGSFTDDPLVHEIGVSGPYSTPVGTTKNTGSPDAPVSRRVVLHQQRSRRPVRELWSGESNGEWQFNYLAAGTYFVVAFDHTGIYGAEAESDIVVPAP